MIPSEFYTGFLGTFWNLKRTDYDAINFVEKNTQICIWQNDGLVDLEPCLVNE